MIEKSSIEANYLDLKGMKIQSIRKTELNETVSPFNERQKYSKLQLFRSLSKGIHEHLINPIGAVEPMIDL
jgi:hypothetical protein